MTTETTAATAVAPAKPFSLHLIGPAIPVFQELCVHVRNGYVVNKDAPLEIFNNGNAQVFLHLGEPNEYAISQAKESTEHAARQEIVKYQADVEQAAKRLIEQERREALEKQVAEAVAASEKAIAKLRKDAEAELAKLAQ
jgi:hypothetical protein